MYRAKRPFLTLALLLAIGLRTVFGAPCCVDWASASQADDAHHHAAQGHHNAAHSDHDGDDDHSEHGDGPTANPCCSACGPTLPPDATLFAALDIPRTQPSPTPIRALATRPPFPAYEATGPPLLI